MAKLYEKIADTKKLGRDEWRALRKTGIGGSDAGAVVGLNPYESAYSVYHVKLSLVEEFEGNDKTRLGQDLEDYVAKRFEEQTGKKVRRLNAMLRSIARPYMIADVDRLVVGEDAGLECKTTANFEGYKFNEGEYPAYWACQCYHYMSVTGAKRWYICVIDLSSGKVAVITIERNESEIKALEEMEYTFWYENVQKQVCPAPNGSDTCEEIIAEKYPTADMDLPAIDLMGYSKELSRLAELKATIKPLEDEKKAIEQSLKEALGASSAGEYGLYKVTYKNTTSARVDVAKLKAEQPEIYAEYLTESTSRRFLFTVQNNQKEK